MTTLREEYLKHKKEKEAAITESAVKWVMENVVLLDENFNRDSLLRLQNSISKFDTTFLPFGSKVPEVKRSLDDAVELLNRITMGEKITRKDGRLRLSTEEEESLQDPATYMIKYMSLLYNNLSRFFNKDMKVLFGLPLFKMAKENPTVALKDLIEAPRMRKAILNALVPGNEIKAILARMYRSMELPTLEYDTIADQLLNLTATDFQELTHVDKVPLVVSNEKTVATENVSTPKEEATSTNPKDKSDEDLLTEEEEMLLKEIGEINPQQVKSVVDGIQKIQSILNSFPELKDTNSALEQLKTQALASIAGGFKNPSSKSVAATANIVYTYFDRLGELGANIEPLIPTDRQMSEEEMKNFESILKKAEGGIMTKIGNFFKTRINPQLSPSAISSQIINVVRNGQSGQNAVAAGQSLKNFFGRLKGLNLPPAIDQQGQPITPEQTSTTPTTGTASTQPTAGTQPTSSTAPTASTQQTSAAPNNTQKPQDGPDVNNLAAAAAKIMGLPQDSQTLKNQLQKLIQSGWTISPPT